MKEIFDIDKRQMIYLDKDQSILDYLIDNRGCKSFNIKKVTEETFRDLIKDRDYDIDMVDSLTVQYDEKSIGDSIKLFPDNKNITGTFSIEKDSIIYNLITRRQEEKDYSYPKSNFITTISTKDLLIEQLKNKKLLIYLGYKYINGIKSNSFIEVEEKEFLKYAVDPHLSNPTVRNIARLKKINR